MKANNIKKSIRNIPDFPVQGIQFKDLTTVFKDPVLFNETVNHTYEYYRNRGITKVLGIESRGFIIGAVLASKLEAGFVPLRKPGKLPAETISKTYSLEYGEDTIEMHKDALNPDDVVLLHDDLLATGGTSRAALELIEIAGIQTIYINFIVELNYLNGRSKLNKNYDIFTLVQF